MSAFFNFTMPSAASGGAASSVAWGDITGTLRDQTDLQAELDNIAAGAGVLSRGDITGLTGGTSTDLDSITTASLNVGTTSVLINVHGGQVWNLQSGTDAEDAAGGVVRPDDYATTTNEKIWVRII